MRRIAAIILTVAVVSTPAAGLAQWQLDGAGLCTAPGEQAAPTIVSDGAGGVIVTWFDVRVNGDPQIYAQRINASGIVQWTPDGVPLCTASNGQLNAKIVSDGAGGAIVTWFDYRSGAPDIYAQRVNAFGVVQWTPNGVPLCTDPGFQIEPKIVADGAGGAIAAWSDSRNDISDLYAQRINAMGIVQWTPNGIAVAAAANSQSGPMLASDGGGGTIVVWSDGRSGNYDVYAQRLNASGVAQWTANGTPLCTAGNDQGSPSIVSDGAGGAIVTWSDSRSGNYDIYTQRIDASGVIQLTPNGLAICALANEQAFPVMVSDGAGGAIMAWHDSRVAGTSDIYAQRIDASGTIQWIPNGVAVCAAADLQDFAAIAADGVGGAVVTWRDARDGPLFNIYAQRLDALGAAQWALDGVRLCTDVNAQSDPRIAPDGTGGAIVTWQDYRSGSTTPDVYAQRVEGTYGYWGHPEPAVTSVADVPNDQGGKVAVNWTASGRDLPVPATIDYYSIWRAVDASALVAGEALTAIEHVGPDTPPHVHATAPSGYYWELVGTQTAYRWANYSFSTQTRSDSVAGNPGTEFFMVAAHAVTDEHIAFASNAVSGHSVDNLAPAAPLYLTAHRIGTDVQLKWNRVRVADLRDYSVYRKTMAGVTPLPANFLSSVEDTVMVDAAAPSSALYYIVTADDVHRNQSPPSNEASVSATTHVGNSPTISRLAVRDNLPNPFVATTTLQIGLPKASTVEIEVFDVTGRSVRRERTGLLAAGWREISFDAHNAGGTLPSGVYFYRVRAAGATVTRKMVIAR